ncbi:hypothetical protein FACS1894188_07030 [Clostridia bacterium]|nr:hypothetical protein FACS1894188_07030 [Clostridia bacterium]
MQVSAKTKHLGAGVVRTGVDLRVDGLSKVTVTGSNVTDTFAMPTVEVTDNARLRVEEGVTVLLDAEDKVLARSGDYTHTVSFDTLVDGLSVEPVRDVKEGTTAIRPENPVRLGYVFGGWWTAQDLETEWDFDVDKVTQTMTLYAQWMPVGQQFVR